MSVELFSLAERANQKLGQLGVVETKTGPLPFLWWYVKDEGKGPCFRYRFAGEEITVMAFREHVVILEHALGASRVGVYKVEPPPAEQLDENTVQACMLYLSSLCHSIDLYDELMQEAVKNR